MRSLQWTWAEFSALTLPEFFEAACLRQAVFVVEQHCPYPDLDALDPVSWHLFGRDADGQLLAYLRLVPPGLKYAEPSLGRVVTANAARGQGLGHPLIAEGLAQSARLWPQLGNRIGAQAHLQAFYGQHGFVAASEIYDEDGIPHLDMLYTPARHGV